MENTHPKAHWEHIYSNKQPHEVSWTQVIPQTSLAFVKAAHLPKHASFIDIGGGDSKFVDFLLAEGFENITVLDISEAALLRAQKRLGSKANAVTWIVCDILDFVPTQSYDFWHDRAAFHFLTTENQVSKYYTIVKQAVAPNGIVTMGTFSKDGPTKCSGLEIQQYSEATLRQVFEEGFENIQCITENHLTPFNTVQNFLFCSFKKIAI